MNILGENYKIKFSKNSTATVVIEGDKVKGNPSENCILLKPYSTASSVEENLVIRGLWKDLSKMDGSTNIIDFITYLKIEKHL